MPRLFAEHFLLPVHDPDNDLPAVTYDEARALNLAPDGRVFVELVGGGDTNTVGTTTKVAHEAEDVFAAETVLGTDTRRAAEQEDPTPESLLGTKTDAIQHEAEDFVSDALLDFDGMPFVGPTQRY
jgi:hypothetical protein